MYGPERRPSRLRALAARGRRVLRRRWDVLLVIAAGGVLGSLARWGVAELLPPSPGGMPWATALVNVAGCLLLGVLLVLVVDVWPPSRYARPFLGTGVLGGFTTFSTYMVDTRGLLVAHRPVLATTYRLGTLAAGLGAVWAGTALATLAVTRRSDTDGRRGRRRRSSGPGSMT